MCVCVCVYVYAHIRRLANARTPNTVGGGGEGTTGGTLVQSKHFENGIVDDTVDDGRRRAAEASAYTIGADAEGGLFI